MNTNSIKGSSNKFCTSSLSHWTVAPALLGGSTAVALRFEPDVVMDLEKGEKEGEEDERREERRRLKERDMLLQERGWKERKGRI